MPSAHWPFGQWHWGNFGVRIAAARFRAIRCNYRLEEEHVSNDDRFVVSCRIHRFLFGAGVDTVGVEKSAWGFPEGFVWLSRKLHRSFHYRSRGPMFGGIHGPGWTSSRSTGFIRNHEDVDGLQTDHALVRTARRPNYARGTVDCKVRRTRWSRGADARHRDLPAPLNRIGLSLAHIWAGPRRDRAVILLR